MLLNTHAQDRLSTRNYPAPNTRVLRLNAPGLDNTNHTFPPVQAGTGMNQMGINNWDHNKPGEFQMKKNLALERIKFRVTVVYHAHHSKHTQINLKTNYLDHAHRITPLPCSNPSSSPPCRGQILTPEQCIWGTLSSAPKSLSKSALSFLTGWSPVTS